MKRHLTSKKKNVLTFVAEFLEKYGYSPSLREISEGLGLYSSSTVHVHVQNLVRNGFLTKKPRTPRSLTLTKEAQLALQPLSFSF